MNKNLYRIYVLTVCLFTVQILNALTVYKCQGTDGSISYSQYQCDSNEATVKTTKLPQSSGLQSNNQSQSITTDTNTEDIPVSKPVTTISNNSGGGELISSSSSLGTAGGSSGGGGSGGGGSGGSGSSGGSSSGGGGAGNANSNGSNSSDTSSSDTNQNTNQESTQVNTENPSNNSESLPDSETNSNEEPNTEVPSAEANTPPTVETELDLPVVENDSPLNSYTVNEPDEFNTITDADFSFFENDWWKNNDKIQNFSFQHILTAPSSPSGIGRIRYPVGHPGGWEPYKMGINGFDYRQIYLSLTFRVSENWQNHPSGVNKLSYLVHNSYGGGGDPCYINMNSTGSERYVEIRTQGPASTKNLTPNLAHVEIIPGQWYLIEVLLDANGTAELWVNGVKTTEYTDVIWGAPGFNEYKLDPVWGGNTGPIVNQEMYLDIDHVYLSGQ